MYVHVHPIRYIILVYIAVGNAILNDLSLTDQTVLPQGKAQGRR